jgi:hypothetical protein
MKSITSLKDLYAERDRQRKLATVHEARYNGLIERAGKALAKSAEARQKMAAVEQAINEEVRSRANGPSGYITIPDGHLEADRGNHAGS